MTTSVPIPRLDNPTGLFQAFERSVEALEKDPMSSTFAQSIPPGKIVLTYDDYCLLPNDGKRYEILDGELSVTPAPAIIHQIILANLHRILAVHNSANPIGRILFAPADVLLARTTVVQPDLVYVANDRSQIITGRAIEGSPTLAVEILSPTTQNTDKITKAQLYAKYQVPHYWLIDPEHRTLEAYELAEDRYVLTTRVLYNDVFAPTLFPGLSFPIADLWA